jgi:PhnB protein
MLLFHAAKLFHVVVIINPFKWRFYPPFDPKSQSRFASTNKQTMTQINAYLNFNGNCIDAMTFYKECLGAELDMQTVEGSPIEAQCPAAMKNQILHATLTKEGLLLMGSDMTGPDGFIKGNTISLSLNCSSEEEISSFFNSLSVGGQIMHTLKTEFWGAIFGVFTDKYGIKWMLNYDKNAK